MARIAIDPVTRVGGHLRIEADIAAGEVQEAWSAGTMFRGIELVMRGRDPRDAWMIAERICGTCTGVHALASVRAVEDALNLPVPNNARLVRNILAATLAVRDHVVQLYLAQLPDWVDSTVALRADPTATSALARSMSDWPQSSAAYFSGVRERIAAVVSSGQPGPLATTFTGHPAYRLSPEQSLILLAHAIEALDWQRDFMRIHTLLGGRDPHPQSYLVGGVSLTPPWGGPPTRRAGEHPQIPERNSPAALSDAGLTLVDGLITNALAFTERVVMPDVLQLAATYEDWGMIGAGIGSYLSYGEYPGSGADGGALFLPRGRIIGRSLASVGQVSEAAVAETASASWYTYDGGDDAPRRPVDGQTNPAYQGPALPLVSLEGANKYSWLKAPRYDGQPMEVGPLARMAVAYVDGQADVRDAMNTALTALGLEPAALFSTLGRIVAKTVETQVLAKRAGGWLTELRTNLATGDLALVNGGSWDPGSWPASAEGWSLGEGPRGAVGHWVSIRDGVIGDYQIVDATTWNASPRDAIGTRGPLEQALVGTRVSDPGQPLEILRTVHSFDPCLACAVHAFDPRAGGPIEICVNRTEPTR